jgi:hypothetical protein
MWSYPRHFQLHNCKIIVAYRTLNHILVIEIGQYLVIHVPRDDKLCRFCSCDVVENEALCARMSLCITPLDISFKLHLFDNAILGSLKSLFQLHHQVNISLHLTKATALPHPRELVCLTSLWCTFSSHKPLGFSDVTIVFISFHFTYMYGRWVEFKVISSHLVIAN